jgi:hypothetical protein
MDDASETQTPLDRCVDAQKRLKDDEVKVEDGRAELRRLMEEAVKERYRQADLARALGLSPARISAILNK